LDEIFFFGGIVVLVLFLPWVLLWRSYGKRRRQQEEDQTRWSQLTERVYALEKKVEGQGEVPVATAPTPPAERPVTAPTAVVPLAPERVEAPRKAPPAPTAPIAPIARTPVPPPVLPTVEHGPSITERFKSTLNLEETLGTNWLNKLGIGLLVIGIASFLAYQLQTMGPAGKVLVGYITSAVILGSGIWFERNHRYRILARAGVGGGWALLFFTTYAMYHVPAAHVLSSQVVDLVLMLLVAAAMVWHTLRYRSQVVTGLAFLLAFTTVTLSHSTVYSLSAGGVLALGLVVVVLHKQWFELEVAGIAAGYLNHYLWLRPIIEPMHGHRHSFPEFAASAGLLTLYWAIFRFSYVVRKPASQRQERVSTAAAILNTALLLLLFKYQSAHPEWAFWALLAIGAIETLLGQLPITRKRRSAVIVLSTLGVILLIAAFPFRYSGSRLSVLWLLEAEALLLIGVWTKEVIFRRLGTLASLLVGGQMINVNAAAVLGVRMDGADLRPQYPVALIFSVAAAVFYLNSHWLANRWSELFANPIDRRLTPYVSYCGALMAGAALWIAFPEAWTAVVWCAFGLALALAARRLLARNLAFQGYLFALAAVVRVFAVNLETSSSTLHVSVRSLTIGAVAMVLYVTAWIQRAESGKSDSGMSLVSRIIPEAYTWVGSFLLGLVAWYELQPVAVAVAWIAGALILLEFGLRFQSRALRLQSYTAFISAFARIFFVNLNAAGHPGELSPRFYTIVPIALACFYAYWRLQGVSDELTGFERRLSPAAVLNYFGTIGVASLMRFELEADWVAAAWAGLAFVLVLIAWRSARRIFLHQSLWLVFGVFFRTCLHNFYQRSYFPAPFWESRLICAGGVIALLFAGLPFAMKLRHKQSEDESGGWRRIFMLVADRPEQVFFFVAVALLTILLALEMRHGMVTLSWGIEGVAVFLLALWLAERSFRLTGLGLLLLCVGKILLVDVWGLNGRDRYLTFIVLGAALLVVSFLYTRNREALREYL